MPTLWSMQAEPLGGASSQPVAIKALSLRGLRGNWKALELFQREAKTLEALQHPGIPKYLEYFEVDTPRDKGFYLVQVTLACCLLPGPGCPRIGWRSKGQVRSL
jgi:serine/threonine protein kinase